MKRNDMLDQIVDYVYRQIKTLQMCGNIEFLFVLLLM